MGKTTNILDLNNRLTKVEKENAAQNSYTSLKNKPKINGVTLTGNKSLADIGAAAASDLATLAEDVGDKTQLTTTDKSSCVGAINELKSGLTNLIVSDIKTSVKQTVAAGNDTMFTIDITKQGYTPMFYTAINTENSLLIPYYYALNGNTLSVAIHNHSDSAKDGVVHVLVLYQHN